MKVLWVDDSVIKIHSDSSQLHQENTVYYSSSSVFWQNYYTYYLGQEDMVVLLKLLSEGTISIQ